MTKGRNHNGRYFELEAEQSTPPTDGDVWDELNEKAKEI
jgi:hypothetical protein